MADLTDVLNALVQVAARSLYPNGDPVPGQKFAPSVTTDSVRIYAGWPGSAALDADLKAGIVNISVFPSPRGEKNTTRFPKEWQESTPAVTTITVPVTGKTITLYGELPRSGVVEYVTVLIGRRKVYSYQITSNDTLSSVAQNLADLIAADFEVSVNGAAITIETSATIVARVGSTGTAWMELRRQERIFTVTIWAPSEVVRTRVARVVDTAFAKIERMTLPDNSSARLIYHGTVESDDAQRVVLYRRDMNFSVEYATSDVQDQFVITAVCQHVQGGISPLDAPVFSTNE